jgi:hypothetical protein
MIRPFGLIIFLPRQNEGVVLSYIVFTIRFYKGFVNKFLLFFLLKMLILTFGFKNPLPPARPG